MLTEETEIHKNEVVDEISLELNHFQFKINMKSQI